MHEKYSYPVMQLRIIYLSVKGAMCSCVMGLSVDARWLLHPIFNDQVRHTLKLSDVVCDQKHIFRSGVRGDQHI